MLFLSLSLRLNVLNVWRAKGGRSRVKNVNTAIKLLITKRASTSLS